MDARKVLLVDDDTDLVALNRVVLEKSGYVVVAAHTGRAGIEMARAEKPDVIVLDVMMTTNSEGFDVARALKGDEATRTIPLLMLTSVNRTVPFRFEPDPTFLPVDRFLEKPLSPEELLKQVRSVVGQ